MTQIKNNINTYADLTAYNADYLNKEYPNISYIQASDDVKIYKYDPDYVVCKYNVTSTESPTQLMDSSMVEKIYKQYIDGVEQQSVQSTYIFDTLGEHIVRYKLFFVSIYQNGFYHCTALTSVTIPSLVTSIGISAFEGCTALTSVGIGSDVTTIDNRAFYNCSSLTSVTIGNSVTTIGTSTFSGCSGLTNVRVGNGVTNIGGSAFYNVGTTTDKATFIFKATNPPTLGTSVFTNNRTVGIYVPAESVNAYKTATNWSSYASKIKAIPNS